MTITLQQYVIELSKYVILGMMLIYTLISYLWFFSPQKKVRSLIYGTQHVLMLVLLFSCFLDLTFVTGDSRYLYLFAFLLFFLFVMILLISLIYADADRFLLSNMCLLLGIGLCMISRLSFAKAYRQFLIAVFSFGISLLIPYLFSRVRFLKKLTWLYAGLGLGMLSVVLILGSLTYGSKITYTVAGITFQPSEFVKILFIFFLAAILWDHHDFKWVLLSAVIAGAHVIVLVASRDLGSALIFFVAYIFVVFMTTGNYLYLLAGFGGGVLASVAAYRLFDHVKVRVLAWADPWTYIDNESYQITQSLFAISGGGWFGTGLTQGNPTDIPLASADFIFSAICEEFGTIFGVCLLLVCFSCFLEMMLVAARIGDRFYQMLVYGIGAMYLFQIFLTVGGGIKFIPSTGVTLPLVSYGGSSVMTTMFMFFIVQGVHIRLEQVERKKMENREVKYFHERPKKGTENK